MNYKDNNRHIVDILFVLALFGVFALSSLMLLSIGASVYKHTVNDMFQYYSDRTSFAYVTEKIRQGDQADCVSIENISGVDTLVIEYPIDDTTYCTYLYIKDGNLMELFCKKDAYLGSDMLSNGQEIMLLKKMNMSMISDKLIYIELTDTSDEILKLYVSTHTNQ